MHAPLHHSLSARVGRCEKSTFTQLHFVDGIPARQVYTFAKQYTDDNHAWVKLADGAGIS